MTRSIGTNAARLVVDLGRGTLARQEIDAGQLHACLGGRGLNVATLRELLPAGADPLGPENVLCFGPGLLTGCGVPSCSRYNATTRSPVSGLLGDANAGGFWAPELKFAGIDQLVIFGRSERPVFLLIIDDEVRLCDATHLWGRTVWETEAALKAELNDSNIQIASIGPAGENLVLFAAVINNLSRAAARTGVGAVMGAKRLKAIVVRGRRGIRVSDPDRLRKIGGELLQVMYRSPSYPLRSTLGTSLLIELYNNMGVLPTRNGRESFFENAEAISGRRLMENYVRKAKSCFDCQVHCSHYYRVDRGSYRGTAGEGPEFETMCAFGSKCGNSDLESILAINNLCNQLGLDTISAGSVISFAMECFENGLLTASDTEGLDLRWGNAPTILELLRRIARREGFGRILGQGVARAAREIPGSERFALHVKGLETPEQEIRALKAWGLGWAVSSRGADHCRAFPLAETTWKPQEAERMFGSPKAADRFSYEAKPEMIKWYEEVNAVVDSLGLCRIAQLGLSMPLELIAEAASAVTGWRLDEQKLMDVGERVVQLERLFNLSQGLTPGDDRLPDRYEQEAVPSGPSAGHTYELAPVLARYYRLRTWDSRTGRPAPETLARLGIAGERNASCRSEQSAEEP